MRSILSITIFLSITFLLSVDGISQDIGEQTAPRLLSVPKIDTTGFGDLTVKVNVNAVGSVDSVESVFGPSPVCAHVARPDIVALREAAKTAALSAKFTPASLSGQAAPGQAFITFPGSEVKTEALGEGYTAGNFEAAPAPKDSGSKDTNRYTVKGDINLVPDYKGPVSNAGSGGGSGTPLSPSTLGDAKQISGGVLNGKAINLPKPTYPPAAKAVRASGAISIQVLIEEDGQVFSAKALSGHPLLRSASTFAACGAKFSPTKLQGNPVKVSGIITYNFVAP